MATDKVTLEVEVTGSEKSINSVKDLKQALKAAKDEQIAMAAAFGEGSKEFTDATNKLSKLKDKVEDLNDSTNSLKGSGLERATQGVSQFKEGLANLDFDKVKVGLTAMKSALAALGIGLIVQAVAYLVENFDSLSKGNGFLSTTLRSVADALAGVKNLITDLIGLTSQYERELEEIGKRLDENATKSLESLTVQSKAYDRAIAQQKALGQSSIETEKAKQANILYTNTLIIKQIENFVRAGGVLDEDRKKRLTAALEGNKDAMSQAKLSIIANEKEITDNHKKELETRSKNAKEASDLEEKYALDRATFEYNRNQAKFKQDEIDRIEKEKQAQLDFEAYVKNQEDEKAVDIDRKEFDKELTKLTEAQKLDITRNGLSSIQQLTDVFFLFKKNKAEKGSKEEEDLARKQFNFNKGLQLGLAVIDGYKAISTSLAQSPIAVGVVPNPIGIASLAFAAITTATNIAKIAATQFGSKGSGSTAASTSIGSAPIPSPPTISTPGANVSGSSFDETGRRIDASSEKSDQVITVNATIGVNEINDKQDKVKVIEKQSTF